MTAASLPTIPKLAASEFRLRHQTGRNPLPTSEHQGAETGEALWVCEIETTQLSQAQGGEWAWLLTSRRGALRSIYLFDNSRPRPLAFHDAEAFGVITCDSTIITCDAEWITGDNEGLSVPAWGSPRIVAVDRDARSIDVVGFYPNATISDGDMGCWDDGAARRLHIIEGATALADGTVTLTVEPPPPETSAVLPAIFTMEKPCAEMLLLSSRRRFSAPVVQRVSLEAMQILRSE